MLANPSQANDPNLSALRAFETAAKNAVSRADSSIAYIAVSRHGKLSWLRMADPDFVPEYDGSGVVIDDRLILTCYHLVRDAEAIMVRLPPLPDRHGIYGAPRISEAIVYAADNRSDLAVLRLKSHDFETRPVEFGRAEELSKGSVVVALTQRFSPGFRDGGPNASWGIISNLRRRIPSEPRDDDRHRSIHFYGTLLQTDARIQSGTSGGALFNLDGKLVGITTAVAALTGSESNGSYAIPMSAGIRRVIDVLRKGEEVEYGFLGVAPPPFPSGRSANPGGRIYNVTKNSPADRVGLRPSDVILQIDGQPIRDADDMFLHIGLGMAGREVSLLIQRPGVQAPFEVKPRLAKYPVTDFGHAHNRPAFVHGLRVDYASVLSRASTEPMFDGVVVREVEQNSAAVQHKLGESDVITEVNGVAVNNPVEFYREAEKATRANQPVRLGLINPKRVVTLP